MLVYGAQHYIYLVQRGLCKITARRRARFNAKCKAENEMQGQNARAGGKASKEATAGPVS
jgi:hypothetical protein